MEPSDEELCKRIAARDADAFELMVDRHQARAYRLASSILGNEADARDVSQDAFIRLYESAGRFDGRSRFSTWFYRILVNLCIDHQRRNRWWRRLAAGFLRPSKQLEKPPEYPAWRKYAQQPERRPWGR